MRDANYNLVKLLLQKLDDNWRVEQHYAKDAKATSCRGCQAVIMRILAADKRHVEMLRKELAKHIKRKTFE